MAQFVPFASGVEVNGQTILSFVNAMPQYKEVVLGILEKNKLKDINPEGWYSQKYWLNAFKEVSEVYGQNTLFAIGKAIPESAKFPPEIRDLRSALDLINVAYHMNHRGGEIGYYKLTAFDDKNMKAEMECKNPYPSEFDRGIITAMARKFKPRESLLVSVELDNAKPSRMKGADSCTYKIKW
jgi:hypothetical protein